MLVRSGFISVFTGFSADSGDIVATRNKDYSTIVLAFYASQAVFHNVYILMIIQNNNQGNLESQ